MEVELELVSFLVGEDVFTDERGYNVIGALRPGVKMDGPPFHLPPFKTLAVFKRSAGDSDTEPFEFGLVDSKDINHMAGNKKFARFNDEGFCIIIGEFPSVRLDSADVYRFAFRFSGKEEFPWSWNVRSTEPEGELA